MNERKVFKEPRPNQFIMNISGIINEWGLLFGLPILRNIPVLRDFPPFGGYFKVSQISISNEDQAILRKLTDPSNAFFFGPNHPEFTTDWLIDKYISVRYAPKMSSWAAASIIRGPLAPFWSANNLIGNDGGKEAKDYSVKCALAGHGTLLHPEGTVRWRSDKVFDLLPGIVDMAIDAVNICKEQSLKKNIYIIPLVWKIVYDHDVCSGLDAAITQLEKTLLLPHSKSNSLGRRYVTLQQRLLRKQMNRFDYSDQIESPKIDDAQRFFDQIFNELSERYEVQGSTDEIHRLLHKIYRKAKEAKNRRDADAVVELQRLAAYSKSTFEKQFFYQEEIAEGLQFIRQIFLTGGYDSVRSMLPKPFGWRTVHLKVPDPIEVSSLCNKEEASDISSQILLRLKQSMDSSLEYLNESTKERLKIPVAE